MASEPALQARIDELTIERDLLLRHIRAMHEANKLGPILSERIIKEVLERANS